MVIFMIDFLCALRPLSVLGVKMFKAEYQLMIYYFLIGNTRSYG